MKRVFELDFHGRKIVVEQGELAKQATGSVLIRYNDTVILTAVVVGKTANLLSDFFPLTVNYQEKLYSVGKIPGGFIKREGKASNKAILNSRLIDRPCRPLFPKAYRKDVQVVTTVLSVDHDCPPEITAMIGASAALHLSHLPWAGPIAGVVVGMVDGEFVINPTMEQKANSVMHITVAGTKDAVMMVEAAAAEISEEVILDAIMFAHEEIKRIVDFILEFIFHALYVAIK